MVDTVTIGTLSGNQRVGNLKTRFLVEKETCHVSHPKEEGWGTLPTEATLRVKLKKTHPQLGRREESVGAADYDKDNSCAELADRDMEMLVNITVILNSSYCV